MREAVVRYGLLTPGENRGDWPEDFKYENGCYLNTCYLCKCHFCGHKRRVVCKECDAATKEDKFA